MTLDQPGFADLVLLMLAAPVIIGAMWGWMKRRTRQEDVARLVTRSARMNRRFRP